MSVPCLYLSCFCNSGDEQHDWFLLVWKHPRLSSLFALGFSPPVYCQKSRLKVFQVWLASSSGFAHQLPYHQIPLRCFLHFCPPKGVQTTALQWRNLNIISPSWLHSLNAHLIYIKWDKGILAHREQRALISFHLACSHRTSFSVELLLDSIKMYGLPNMFKWLFGPHHPREKANKICPIYLNRDGRELGGDSSI